MRTKLKIQWELWLSEHASYLRASSSMTTKSDVCWKPSAFIYNWGYPYKSPGSNHIRINTLRLHYFIFKEMALLFKHGQQNLSLLLNFPPLTARNVSVGLIFGLHLLWGQKERAEEQSGSAFRRLGWNVCALSLSVRSRGAQHKLH